LKIKTQEEALKEKNDAVSSLQTDIKQIKTIRSIFFLFYLKLIFLNSSQPKAKFLKIL
jgi:hypothetical protein